MYFVIHGLNKFSGVTSVLTATNIIYRLSSLVCYICYTCGLLVILQVLFYQQFPVFFVVVCFLTVFFQVQVQLVLEQIPCRRNSC